MRDFDDAHPIQVKKTRVGFQVLHSKNYSCDLSLSIKIGRSKKKGPSIDGPI